jgi:hypothetical protein
MSPPDAVPPNAPSVPFAAFPRPPSAEIVEIVCVPDATLDVPPVPPLELPYATPPPPPPITVTLITVFPVGIVKVPEEVIS